MANLDANTEEGGVPAHTEPPFSRAEKPPKTPEELAEIAYLANQPRL